MNILIAPDSFKDSLDASEVAACIQKGFSSVFPHANYHLVPITDGGEGFFHIISKSREGIIKNVNTFDALLNPISASYFIDTVSHTAFIEMASSCGLEKIHYSKRNPLLTSSYGVGVMINDALSSDINRIVIGVGGSATNDGGAGMLEALGVQFYDCHGSLLHLNGQTLSKIDTIDFSNLHPHFNHVHFELACDVTNPLVGTQGTTYTFGAQKGATSEMLPILENSLNHYGHLLESQFNRPLIHIQGIGAGGGLPLSLFISNHVKITPGFEVIAQLLSFEAYVKNADLVITGEGRLDGQSIFGKTPIAVAQYAKKYGVPVIAIVGSLGEGDELVYDFGIDSVFSIIHNPCQLEDALILVKENLIKRSSQVARLIKVASKINKKTES